VQFVYSYAGVIVTIWITLGVYWVGKRYPNYDHWQNFCSELGAKGSPTEKLSPLINNYPLGFLFCVSGWQLAKIAPNNLPLFTAGCLVILHGIGTWFAGYFPMDKDPYTETPSLSCQIHSWAGFVMLLSLLIAPLLVAFSYETEFISITFRVYSVMTCIVAVYFLMRMARAFKTRKNVGLHQRLSYWVKLIWLSLLTLHVAV